VTRLLSGERDYLQADPEMRDKLQAELASPHAIRAASVSSRGQGFRSRPKRFVEYVR
jgi:hypothetical protein